MLNVRLWYFKAWAAWLGGRHLAPGLRGHSGPNHSLLWEVNLCTVGLGASLASTHEMAPHTQLDTQKMLQTRPHIPQDENCPY